MQETILQSIGRTPLVRLRRLTEELQAKVYVKVEAMNPGGSIKDRVAVAMITEAERRKWLQPGGTIIEATAGNTGLGLAMAAAVKGYRCIFVLPDKMSAEKIRLLQAYGAEVEDPQRRRPDISRLVARTGFQPEIGLEEIVAELIAARAGVGAAAV